MDDITTIIATTASERRSPLLRRAIASVRAASQQPVKIIVVVNGDQKSADMCQWLANQPDVSLEILAEASLHKALLHGRTLVQTTYFSILDDDDEYLPSGLDKRLAVFLKHPQADVVVTNGYRCIGSTDVPSYQNLPALLENPLVGLFEANWLHSCNCLFRCATVGRHYFENGQPYAEWSWLAFRLCIDGKSIFMTDEKTFRYNDTPESLSKSPKMNTAYLNMFDRMLACALPAQVVKKILRKKSAEHHGVSVVALNSGQLGLAWHHHGQSLRLPTGMRYASYTWRLVWASLTRRQEVGVV